MTKITIKQKNINRILRKLEKINFFDDEDAPKVKTYTSLKSIITDIMDGSEEDTVKGLDMILGEPKLRKLFTKKEINEYIYFAQRHYVQPNRYNLLYKILKEHKYKSNDPDIIYFFK